MPSYVAIRGPRIEEGDEERGRTAPSGAFLPPSPGSHSLSHLDLRAWITPVWSFQSRTPLSLHQVTQIQPDFFPQSFCYQPLAHPVGITAIFDPCS